MPDNPDAPAAASWPADAVIDWLIEEGRFSDDLDALVQRLGARLLAAGAPVWRVRLSVRTIHPLIAAVTSVWEKERGRVEPVESPHGFEGGAGYEGSPVLTIVQTRSPLRKRLGEGLSGDDHSILHDLRARGATDYYGLPLRLTRERLATLVFVTDAPAGFSDADIAAFDRIAIVLAPIVETFRLRQLSLAVAEAYLGKRTGRRVLEGQITRGHVETIDAAILVSDIRDWTGLNDRMPAEAAVGWANRCFDLLAAAIDANGGEILKFVGDGVLAVFPAGDDDPGAAAACSRALAAARDALRAADGSDLPNDVRFGIGLNCGDVLYGNVGSASRLDFTVMGQAVNVAARIEGLCEATGRPLLFSQRFADAIPEPAVPVTAAVLKGQQAETTVYTVADPS